MTGFNMVARCPESTVVAAYTPSDVRSDAYQSEAALEAEFIRQLCSQGYEYLPLHEEKMLVENLRNQLELLNNFRFSDEEWARFFHQQLANNQDGIEEKTKRIQEDCILNLIRDDGSTKNITLIDKKNIHNNRLQVINQYEENGGSHDTRYDVTILVNGFPLVHVELKRRGVAIREAFNQIKRYQRDSFWASSGLYEYVQIFVISNGTHTKYYSNTTRESHIKEQGAGGRRKSKKTSNSFEFTSFWADGNNKPISDLVDFTKTFFSKHTLLNILTRFCVFTSEKLLLVMRPYQITATERILSRIEISSNYHKEGSLEAGGYIWHTTGSGKTLTSFKTAQLASRFPFIDKVLFVVDRRDLDYQTMQEYEKFQKGAANSNTSTNVLQKQLEDSTSHIIITTIQKLDTFVSRNPRHDVYKKHVVIIFDECHRSQFGDMHLKIVRAFKKYHIFGFTGTPVFAQNAGSGGNLRLKTTPQAFGDQLHTYTIVDAINDGNVLPFRIDYVNTIKMADDVRDEQVRAINTEKVLNSPERISEIVRYILDHFDQKTKRSSFYTLKGQRVAGFNSILAVSSIPMAMKYYAEFKRQLEERKRKLTIATIFSYGANEDAPEDSLGDESFNTEDLDQTSRDFLDGAIKDYNVVFHTNFDTSSAKFYNFYKDLSLRMKKREVDLLIVVNMFLTGFDATTLNTLWVDKNLKMHGLIQAFSRTNRILNSVKTFGNIVCFRDLQKETDEALALFGNKDAGGIVLLKTYDAYYQGYDEDGKHRPGYTELINALLTHFPLGVAIVGEQNEKDFISLFGSLLRLKNILTSFDEFEGQEIISTRDFQDYQSRYLDLYQKWSNHEDGEKEDINSDIVFEMELVRQVEINIDYILMLIEKYRDSHCRNKEILTTIDKAIGSSIELRSKKTLIEEFIERINASSSVQEDWQHYVREKKEADLSDIIAKENLKPEPAETFMNNAFRDGTLKTTGTDIDRLLPPMSRFGGGNRESVKKRVIDKLRAFFEKYLGIV